MTSPAEPERQIPKRGPARIAAVALWVFAAGFASGAVQVGRALRSGQRWANYRGEVIEPAEMRHTLVLLVVAATICTLLAWRWQRLLRRSP
jgi:ABC-type Fe3+ transport system permease subunit